MLTFFPWEEEELLARNANWLLQQLYCPDTKRGAIYRTDERFDEEPINWGDLSAAVDKRPDGVFVISLEEAAPDDCPNLCDYIRGWLVKWGWESIEVVTEW